MKLGEAPPGELAPGGCSPVALTPGESIRVGFGAVLGEAGDLTIAAQAKVSATQRQRAASADAKKSNREECCQM